MANKDNSVRVRITGLTELAAALRQLNKELPAELRKAFYQVAKDIVGKVQQRMPWGTGEAAKSLKPVSGSSYAGISRPAGGRPWKGVAADYYPWLDFGGTTGRGHWPGRSGSGSISRTFIKEGRFLYPAISEASAEILIATEQAMTGVAGNAGFETR